MSVLIEALLTAIAGLFDLLLYPLRMQQIPQNVLTTAELFLAYVADGISIIAAYTHFTYLLVLLSVCIVVDAVHTLYIVLMWILRKIPLLNIS